VCCIGALIYRRRSVHRKVLAKNDVIHQREITIDDDIGANPEAQRKAAEDEFMRRLSIIVPYNFDHDQSMASARGSPTFSAVVGVHLEPERPPVAAPPIRKVMSKRHFRAELVVEDESSMLPSDSSVRIRPQKQHVDVTSPVLSVINEELYVQARKEAFSDVLQVEAEQHNSTCDTVQQSSTSFRKLSKRYLPTQALVQEDGAPMQRVESFRRNAWEQAMPQVGQPDSIAFTMPAIAEESRRNTAGSIDHVDNTPIAALHQATAIADVPEAGTLAVPSVPIQGRETAAESQPLPEVGSTQTNAPQRKRVRKVGKIKQVLVEEDDEQVGAAAPPEIVVEPTPAPMPTQILAREEREYGKRSASANSKRVKKPEKRTQALVEELDDDTTATTSSSAGILGAPDRAAPSTNERTPSRDVPPLPQYGALVVADTNKSKRKRKVPQIQMAIFDEVDSDGDEATSKLPITANANSKAPVAANNAADIVAPSPTATAAPVAKSEPTPNAALSFHSMIGRIASQILASTQHSAPELIPGTPDVQTERAAIVRPPSSPSKKVPVRRTKTPIHCDMREISEREEDEVAATLPGPSPARFAQLTLRPALLLSPGPQTGRPDALIDFPSARSARGQMQNPLSPPMRKAELQRNDDSVMFTLDESVALPSSPTRLAPVRRVPSALFARSTTPVLSERTPSARLLAPVRSASRSRLRDDRGGPPGQPPDTSLVIMDV
jgi:hypothetical protein